MNSLFERIEVLRGDITRIPVDVMVNAANSSLLGGGGVDGAIHRAAGPELLEHCRKIVAKQGNCKTGEAVITPAGKLPAKFVIHTVGPVWNGGNRGEAALLANCYRNALILAGENECNTVSFPNISTGVYRFPRAAAAAIAVQTVFSFLKENKMPQKIIFVCFDDENFLYTSREAEKYRL
jgi:O-acetyl-ADP-ribose deacetylase